MKKSKLNVSLVIIGIILIIGIVFLFFYLGDKDSSSSDIFKDFSDTETERIKYALQNMDEFGNSAELRLILSEFELGKSIMLCDRELIKDAISCYKLLSIQKPENKDEICSHINLELCDRPSVGLYCADSIDEHREECLLGLPSFGR